MGLLDSLKGLFNKGDAAPTEGPTTTPDATPLNGTDASSAPVDSAPSAPEAPQDLTPPAGAAPEAPVTPPADTPQDTPVDPTAQPQQ